MQDILAGVLESGTTTNPAYNTILTDYIVYHVILIAFGSVFLAANLLLTAVAGKRLGADLSGLPHSLSRFERKSYLFFALTGTLVALMMSIIIAANLSNVIVPHDGLAQAFPDKTSERTGTQQVLLDQAVKHWVESGEFQMPRILQDAVRDRLSWQQPKAVIYSILFLVSLIFTMKLWSSLIKNSRSKISATGPKNKLLVTIAIFGVPVTLLTMIVAIVNTQASFAPIAITLSFS